MQRKMHYAKWLVALIITAAQWMLLGCGSGASSNSGATQSDPPTGIALSISPAQTSVEVDGSVQFNAAVKNDPANKGVVWSVTAANGAVCKGCGQIDATGKYTASSIVHAAPGLYIVATSVSDPSKSANAVVYVTPAPLGVAVTPSIATIAGGAKQQFVATGKPFGSIPVVTWSVSGDGCSGADCGTIDVNGEYVAPAAIPNPPLVTVKGSSTLDTRIFGLATVRLGSNADNAKLTGPYAFLLQGYDGDGNMMMAGSFVADGTGKITSGIADINWDSGFGSELGIPFGGYYSVGADGRASISISLPDFDESFAVALSNLNGGVASKGRIIELGAEQMWQTGILARQDASAFSTEAIEGGYAFGFAGTAYSGYPMTATGRFTANAGSLSAGQVDVFGLGLREDGSGTAYGISKLPFNGQYSVAAAGRGSVALTFAGPTPDFNNFNFYVVSSTELLFIETDRCAAEVRCTLKTGVSGEAIRQSGGPFTATSLNGSAIFNATSAGAGTQVGGGVTVGREVFDGNGNFTGIEDGNLDGMTNRSNFQFAGTYSVDNDGLGRGALTILDDGRQESFYLVSPGKGFAIDRYESGTFEPQVGDSFSDAALSDNYALGALSWNFNWTYIPDSGVLSANAEGGLSGTSDSVSGTGITYEGSYSTASNGRTTLSFTPAEGASSSWVFYLASPTKALGICTDPESSASPIGVIEK